MPLFTGDTVAGAMGWGKQILLSTSQSWERRARTGLKQRCVVRVRCPRAPRGDLPRYRIKVHVREVTIVH
eukprot:7887845-Pyramimonas_sp.AAC.1